MNVNSPEPVLVFVSDDNLKGEKATTTALLALNTKFESDSIVGVPVPVSINAGAYIGSDDKTPLHVIEPVVILFIFKLTNPFPSPEKLDDMLDAEMWPSTFKAGQLGLLPDI